jgi:hypothetical protein
LYKTFFITVDVCSVWSDNWKVSNELKDQIYTSVKPIAGPNAGKYSRYKKKQSIQKLIVDLFFSELKYPVGKNV